MRRRAALTLIAAAVRAAAGFAATAACAGDDEEVVTLRITSWQSPEENAIDAESWREFERRHPGVRVVNDPVSNQAEYRERVITSIAAGTPPDVFLLDGIDMRAFVDAGVLLDLAPFARRVGLDLDDFYPSVLAQFSRGARVYALPKGFTPMVYYYNKELFDRAGLPYPRNGWTVGEFVRAAKALTRDTDGDGTVDQWGTVLDRRFFAWQSWLWSAGGDILSPDGTRATGYLDSPQTDSVVRLLASFPGELGIAPRPNAFRAATGNEQRLFYSGRVALLTSGHWLIPNIRRYLEQGRVRLGVVSVPRGEGRPLRTVIFASAYAVPFNTPHRKLAVELAAWMSGREAQRRRLAAGLELATMPAVQLSAPGDPYGLESSFVWQVSYGAAPWGVRVARFREVEAQMFDVLDRVLINGEDVNVVTADVARRVDAILTR